jgi:hypothetical protein
MQIDRILRGIDHNDKQLLAILRRFVENRTKNLELHNSTISDDLKRLRKSAVAPFAFCNQLINDMRFALKVFFD